ncbi:succinate dehydrogenase, hydrophobic membrane anchor protein [Alteromonas sediminis]|uniref:Succinate dehydrogenase hydrophobic membrane anchor subunit n=1 Tax=Alteromonas sediminis TaxID=2259342 RepID=A0A3N5Z9B9_9ALTE|nr:succinate dehydrogenase, hydrophobic membrane anchor protein [Alteromonas sediminis]RPJ67594.1 succinate dehydrogenase, hydrophobic membrane anchor protein [Alteromonas sediminis]
MVTNQASIKRDGVQDYVSLRATAAIITAFTLYLAWFFITTDNITFEVWQGLFSSIGMKVFTLAALVAIMIHVRIGLWQVLTDYVKPTGLRATLQYVLNIIAFVYVAVGLFVLWGV